MGEEFYCILKLVSGEEIFALISIDEDYEDPVIILQNPIVINVIQNSNGYYVKVKSWMEMSSDEIFIIRKDKIITMTESKDERLISLYHNYNNDQSLNDINVMEIPNNDGSHKVKPSTKMGYISSVEEARKKLENLFNGS